MTALRTISHLIDGRLADGFTATTRFADVFDPSTGRPAARVALADRRTVEDAIASAQKALPGWKATPPLKRARVMSRLKTLLEENAHRICELITLEHGKVLADCRRRSKSEPPCRPNIEPGVEASLDLTGCG
jgi:malonate-semialdehyde dehydrogenase (acetylating)/methylmalonate-semialdehyde dehydrogenase